MFALPLIADTRKKIVCIFLVENRVMMMMESSMNRLIKWRMRAGFYSRAVIRVRSQ